MIMDGDFGPDDMMALLYLLGRPDVDLAAVTVTGTGLAHCPAGAANAASVLRHMDREEVPVACGETTPRAGSNTFPAEWRDGADQLGAQLGLDPSPDGVASDASQLIVDTVEGAADQVEILALGPLTDIAAALEIEPGIADRIDRLVVMGGALDVSGTVPPENAAEWNLWVDPRAAVEVLASEVPMTIVPLDATNDVPATRFFFETLQPLRDSPGAELVYRFFEASPSSLDGGAYFFWDPLAAVTLVEPDVVTIESRAVSVVETGARAGALSEAEDGVPVDIALAADRRAFESAFLTALNGGEPVAAQIPTPDLVVTFDGDSCTLEGETSFESDEPTTRIVVELVNESELGLSVVTGLHEGFTWDRLVYDAARVRTQGPPDYWEQTGLVTISAESQTGGRATGPIDLAPGYHALACGISDSRVEMLAELVVGNRDPQ